MIKFEYTSLDKTFKINDDLVLELIKGNSKLSCPTITKMSLTCDKDFSVLINGNEIKIKENLGFEMDYKDPSIKSFKLLTDSVTIYALIAYSVKENK